MVLLNLLETRNQCCLWKWELSRIYSASQCVNGRAKCFCYSNPLKSEKPEIQSCPPWKQQSSPKRERERKSFGPIYKKDLEQHCHLNYKIWLIIDRDLVFSTSSLATHTKNLSPNVSDSITYPRGI